LGRSHLGRAFVTRKRTEKELGLGDVRESIEAAHLGTLDFANKSGEKMSVTFARRRKQGDSDRGFDVRG
jgi:hypothetical protein